MDIETERRGIEDLLKTLEGWILVEVQESPDFIIKNINTGECVGVEVTEYYPHRNGKNQALVRKKGKSEDENEGIKHQLFEKTDYGYSRFVPDLDMDDFLASRLRPKEKKLFDYKAKHKECKEFWLLVLLNFYDNISSKEAPSIPTQYDRVFFWSEPNTVQEMMIENRIIPKLETRK